MLGRDLHMTNLRMTALVPGSEPVSEDGAEAPKVLETFQLTKAFGGVVAVDSVDFEARPGEVHGLLGENGAGKSTFIKLVAGALQSDSGQIRLDGRPLESGRLSSQSRKVGAVFQELSLIPDLTVAENVWLGREPLNRLGRVLDPRCYGEDGATFRRAGVHSDHPRRQVRLLSVAERHLVETAKVLSTRPTVVIFDETTSALGPSETEWLLLQARALAKERRIVLFISHRLAGDARRCGLRDSVQGWSDCGGPSSSRI